MKVNNTSIFMGDDTLCIRHDKQPNSKGISERKSIDASNLHVKLDPIAAKKEEARKKAMKIVGDAFANERKIDDDLRARNERIKSLQNDKGEAEKTIKEIEDGRAALRDEYNIDENSQEEKDLKLLEKEIRAKMPGSDIRLTKDDIEAINQIKKGGLSEYQQRSLEMLEFEVPHANTAYEAGEEIKLENQIISATKIERLKSHAILDAEKQADSIVEEASKEILGMLIDEAKEHIDEEAEKQEERAKAEKEKQEELQERIDAAKEKKKENEELTEDILEEVSENASMASDVSAVQQEIKDMMNKMKLIEDDIKGVAVDKSV